MPSFFLAIILALTALVCFSAMEVLVKMLRLSSDIPPTLISFARNAFGLLPVCLTLAISKQWHAAGRPLHFRQWKLALLRGSIVAVAQLALYTSLKYIPLAVATTIENISPVLITLLAIPILGDRIGIWRGAAVFVGFLGVLWIMNPFSAAFSWLWLLPLLAALGYSLILVMTRLFDKDALSPLITLYTGLSAILGSFLLCLFDGGFAATPTGQDFAYLLAIGCAGGIGAVIFTMAYRLESPANLAPFNFFSIPLSMTFGLALLGEWPIDTLFPGALLIIAAGMIIIFRERILRRRGTG